mmetsp:Transcript_68434/g.164309  ORF Transcript_68434/g.164309 Transcript_68434/m.164309 type:complete len:153 (+) Transcript_68434:83-541(+)
MAAVADHHGDHEEGHAVWAGPENDGTLAYRMEDYLMSGSFLRELDGFVKKHLPAFEDLEGGEHPHDYHDIFKLYEEMLSARIEAFLIAEGVTTEQVVEECKWAKTHGHDDYKFYEYLVASVEYESFYKLMLEFKRGQRDVSKWWTFFMNRDN